MAPLAQRLAAARRIARHPRIVVTAIEDQLGTRFTADTLAKLVRRFPQLRFVWLMGSDNLVQIPRWHAWSSIFARVPVAVMPRPGSVLAARVSKAARTYSFALVPFDARLPRRHPPALAFHEGARHPASASAIRADMTRERMDGAPALW
jgi:nicotinate-nucleotide adenylyltransferase